MPLLTVLGDNLHLAQILESWRTKRLLPADVLNDALQTLEGRRALSVPPCLLCSSSQDRPTDLLSLAFGCRAHTHSAEGTPSATASGAAASSSSSSSKRRKKAGGEGFSTGETVRRMEEDRERVRPASFRFLSSPRCQQLTRTSPRPPLPTLQHKRVRERLWVLPLPSAASTALSITPPSAFSSDAPRPPPPALASLLPSSVAGSTAYVLAAGAAGESPATSTTTPQSPFTPSPASTSLGGAGTRPVIRAAGPVDRGGLERAVDREFEAGWEDEGAWDEVDCGECQRENELCWPERIAGV